MISIFFFSTFLPRRQFCLQAVQSRGAFCRHLNEGGSEGSLRVVEANRRRLVVDVRLDNKGENAYNARLNISYSPNLRFSSLILKVCAHSEWVRFFCEERCSYFGTCGVLYPRTTRTSKLIVTLRTNWNVRRSAMSVLHSWSQKHRWAIVVLMREK